MEFSTRPSAPQGLDRSAHPPTGTASAPPEAPVLSHPWGGEQPALGQTMTVRPGLHWVRMPLPFALNHINLWVLADELDGQPGWCVIDCGISTETIHQAWQALWQGPLQGTPLARVLATHMHPDHVGNAQWLIEQFSVPGQAARLWMSTGDYLAATVSHKETTGYGGERAAAYFAAHGLQDAQALGQIRQRGGYFASMVPALPRAYRRLMDGMEVRIGAHTWRCIAGFGHSPEHMALHCAELGVLISGDMLLPKISTNISVTDMEPEADALGLFLTSLSRFEALPPDTLVLPSHGLPFVGIHTRVAQLRTHHAERLADIRRLARTQAVTAADLLPVLFNRALDQHQITFAMGEAVAHLNHLWHQGAMRRERDAQGVWRFSLA